MTRLKAQLWDGMLMLHLASPDLPKDLEFAASLYTSKPAWKHLEKSDVGGGSKETYNARDVDVTLQIFPQLKAILRQQELLDVYELVSVPMGKVSLLLRKLGVKTDSSRIGEVRERLSATSSKLEESLPEQLRSRDEPCNRRIPAPPGSTGKSGKPVRFLTVASSERLTPWRSDKTVGEWLYGELKLPVQYHVKTKKQTTDKTALDKLYRMARADTRVASHANSILAIKKLRQIDETLTTFCKDKMQYGSSIHTSFNVHGTSSGRLSSSDPNLQNIPEDTRCIYIPHYAGWKILQFDYSQIENRITAFLAHDSDRLKRLNDPEFSEHKWAASQFFGIPYEEVVKDNDKEAPYGKAKRIVHGSNYGMGARKIANLYDLQESEVKKLLATWKGAILRTSQWQEQVASEAKREGVLQNAFSRKRWFYCVAPETRTLTPDLRWVSVGSLNIGDKLIAFDESLSTHEGVPKYRESVVTDTSIINAPRMKVTTDKGTVICTPNHGWATRLAFGLGGVKRYTHRWISTEYLQPGDSIIWFTSPWEVDYSYLGGRLSGLLDGEGHIGHGQARGSVGFTQKLGAIMDYFLAGCQQLGITTTEPRPTGDGSAFETRLHVNAPRQALEIVGRLQPIRLIYNARKLWENRAMWGNTTRHEVAIVQAIEPLEEGPVVALSTSTKTLLTEGLCSHNTSSYYTEALSFLPQSTAADILLRAMIVLMHERINWPLEKVQQIAQVVRPLPKPADLLLTVHDSLVFECPPEGVDEVVAIVRDVMSQGWPELAGFSCPVSVEIGDSWGEMEKFVA